MIAGSGAIGVVMTVGGCAWGATPFRNTTETTSWFDRDPDRRLPLKGAQVQSQGRSPLLDQGPDIPLRGATPRGGSR